MEQWRWNILKYLPVFKYRQRGLSIAQLPKEGWFVWTQWRISQVVRTALNLWRMTSPWFLLLKPKGLMPWKPHLLHTFCIHNLCISHICTIIMLIAQWYDEGLLCFLFLFDWCCTYIKLVGLTPAQRNLKRMCCNVSLTDCETLAPEQEGECRDAASLANTCTTYVWLHIWLFTIAQHILPCLLP